MSEWMSSKSSSERSPAPLRQAGIPVSYTSAKPSRPKVEPSILVLLYLPVVVALVVLGVAIVWYAMRYNTMMAELAGNLPTPGSNSPVSMLQFGAFLTTTFISFAGVAACVAAFISKRGRYRYVAKIWQVIYWILVAVVALPALRFVVYMVYIRFFH